MVAIRQNREDRQIPYSISKCIQSCTEYSIEMLLLEPRVDSSASLLRVSRWGLGRLTRLVIPEHTKQIQKYVYVVCMRMHRRAEEESSKV